MLLEDIKKVSELHPEVHVKDDRSRRLSRKKSQHETHWVEENSQSAHLVEHREHVLVVLSTK